MKLITEINEHIKIVTEGTGANKHHYIEGVFLQSGIKNRNGRMYPIEIMKREVQRYSEEFVKQNRAFGELGHPECYLSNDFDVLTDIGWKSFTQLSVSDNVLTLNDHNEIEINPIIKLIDEPYIGHGYHIHSRNIDSKLTPNHRMILEDRYGNREEATIEQIYQNRAKYNKHKIVKTGKWNSMSNPDCIIIPGIEQEKYCKKFKNDVSKPLVFDACVFAQFMGIWLAEGSTSPTKYNIFLNQNEGEKAEKIRELLNKFPNEIVWKEYKRKNNKGIVFSTSDIRLHRYLKKLGNKYNKHIPQEIKNLDASVLDELLQWFIMGDGRTENNRQNLFSVSKKLVEDLHECLIKSGGSGNWTVIDPQDDYVFAGRTIKAKNKKRLYQLNVSTTSGIYLDSRFVNIDKIEHDGNVYCLQVKNSNFYVKQNNKAYWTGNSPSINLERVSHMIKSLTPDGKNYIGKAKIMDTPYGKIVKNLMDEGAKLGVSSRGIGSLEEVNGVNVVNDDFKLSTAADIVADPSAPDAFVRGVMESKEWIYESGVLKSVEIETYKKIIQKASSRKLEETTLNAFKNFLSKL